MTVKSVFGASKHRKSASLINLILSSILIIACLRIRSANILLLSIRALANEIAKNLVLAGIHSITLVDHELVTEEDLGSQFLVTDTDIGQNVMWTFFNRSGVIADDFLAR